MLPSSRTPEGDPIRCNICGAKSFIEPSNPPGDVPCPNCGELIWVEETIAKKISRTKTSIRQFVEETHSLAASGASREELGDYLVAGLRDCLEAYGATLWICSRQRWWSRRLDVRASSSCGQTNPTKRFAEQLANDVDRQPAIAQDDSVLYLGVPIAIAGRTVGVIEVLQRSEIPAGARRGYLILIDQMAQVVGQSAAFAA